MWRAALWPLLLVSFFALAASLIRIQPEWLGILPPTLIATLFLLERWVPNDAHQPLGSDPALGHDVGHNLFGSGLASFFGEGMLVVAAALLGERIGQAFGGTVWPRDWPWLAQATLFLVLAEGLEYLRHRAEHEVPWLWRIHSLHHSIDRLHALKGGRNHVLDLLTRSVVVFAPLVALGAPGEIVWVYTGVIAVLGPISHTCIDFRFPRWVHYCLVTPPGHRVHHARDTQLAMSNYAPIFPMWDVLFGSFRHPDDEPVLPPVGIENDPQPASFLGQLAYPFRAGRADAGAASASETNPVVG